MSQELVFKKLDGTVIDNVNEYVRDWSKKYPHGEIVIGCDSQEHSRFVKYAIVIVMHIFHESKESNPSRTGKGAHVIQATLMDSGHKTPRSANGMKKGKKTFDTSMLQGKLWREVELTIQAAQLLEGCNKKIKIHVDYNSDEAAVSNALYAPGIGYAQGMGYEAQGKPHAWASSTVADRLCR